MDNMFYFFFRVFYLEIFKIKRYIIFVWSVLFYNIICLIELDIRIKLMIYDFKFLERKELIN